MKGYLATPYFKSKLQYFMYNRLHRKLPICSLLLFTATALPNIVGAQKTVPVVAESLDCSTINFGYVGFAVKKSGTVSIPKSGTVSIPKSGTVSIPKGTNRILDLSDVRLLDVVSQMLKNNPDCRIKISGHSESTKVSNELSWERVNAIRRFLIEQRGIAGNRLVFEYGVAGDVDIVDLLPTTDEGPLEVPVPYPGLMSKQSFY